MSAYSSESQNSFTSVAWDDIPPPPGTAKLLFMDTLLHTYPLTQEIYNATEYTSDIGVVEKHFTWLWEELPEWERQCWIDEHYRVSLLYQEMYPDWERNPWASQSIIRLSPEEEMEKQIQDALRPYPLEWFKATVRIDSIEGFDGEYDGTFMETLSSSLTGLYDPSQTRYGRATVSH
ncbi:hypothetical protein H1R20_g7556, partial [Candolleomyces eurysporus]